MRQFTHYDKIQFQLKYSSHSSEKIFLRKEKDKDKLKPKSKPKGFFCVKMNYTHSE